MAKKKEIYGVKPKVEVKEVSKTHNYQTIFTIVERNKNFNIAVGNKIVSKLTFVTLKEAKDYIDSKPYELIVNATCCIYEISQTLKK